MNAQEAGWLMRFARDKTLREIEMPQLAPGTVTNVVSSPSIIPVPFARVQMDGPQADAIVLDVPILSSTIPSVGDRVLVAFNPPHGATLAGPISGSSLPSVVRLSNDCEHSS